MGVEVLYAVIGLLIMAAALADSDAGTRDRVILFTIGFLFTIPLVYNVWRTLQ